MMLLKFLGEIALGFGLLRWLAGRASRDPWLRRVVLLSYSLRVALGVFLYIVSLHHWPLLRSLQMNHGFWGFAPDGGVYHYFGQQIADAWRKGIELPDTVFGFEYFALVAAVYRLLGPHPLFPIIVNCALGTGTGLLAYLISRRFLTERMALVSAALVSFWPSTFLWSAQLLKDPLSWFLLFAALALIMRRIPQEPMVQRGRLPLEVFRWALLSLVMILLTRARFYLGSALSLAALLVLLPAGCVAFIRKAPRRGIHVISLVAVIVLSTLFARTLNVAKFLSPANPEVAHYYLAVGHWEKGELIEATREFYRTLELRSDFQEAYLGVAAVQIQLVDLERAIRAYEAYMDRAVPEERQPIALIIARLYVELGNECFRNRQVAQAIAAYERAIAFNPSQVDAVANLGLTLAKLRNFERAFAMCAQALRLVTSAHEAARINRVVTLAFLEKGDYELNKPRRGVKDVEAAFAAYEHASQFDPAHAAVYLGLGHALDQMGLFDQALVVFRHAWELSAPGAEEDQVKRAIATVFSNKGNAALSKYPQTTENYQTAMAAYERVLLFDPTQVEAFLGIGRVFAGLRRPEAATQAYTRALELAKVELTPDLITSIAHVCAQTGDCAFSKGDRAGILGILGLAEPPPARADLSVQPLQALGLSSAPLESSPTNAALPAGSPPPGGLPVQPVQTHAADAWLHGMTAQSISENRDEILTMAIGLFSSRTGHSEKGLGGKMRSFREFLAQWDDQATKMVSESTAGALGYRREGFLAARGHALMDGEIRITDRRTFIQYAPRALAIGLLAPFPWQWFDVRGSTGPMRIPAGMEALLLYLLIPAILVGVWDAITRRRLDVLFLLAVVAAIAIPLSVVVANLGTLFRLRLLFMLPLMIIAAQGDPVGMYAKSWEWLRARGLWRWMGDRTPESPPCAPVPVGADEPREASV